MSETFPRGLARRVLTQELSIDLLSRGDVKNEVAGLAPHVGPLSESFTFTREAASQALRDQQMAMANDIQALFPADGEMDHVAAQVSAKVGGPAERVRAPRER